MDGLTRALHPARRVRWMEIASDAVGRALETLHAPRSLPLLQVGVFLAALGYCLLLFSPGFLAGTAAFWGNPRGLLEGSWADMPTALSGYFYFVQDGWHLPLFHVAALGGEGGTNIIFTDSIPLVALLGRLLYELTGYCENLYGIWIAVCFIASALAMTWLVALLGQRSIASTVAATVLGLCMPALLHRFGHMSLMAQFEITLALGFAVGLKRSCRPMSCFVLAALLCLLSLWTHAYLFAMVSALVFAGILQAMLDRSLGLLAGSLILAGLVIFLAAVVLLSGHLTGAQSLSDAGFGYYSLNLLSLFAPRESGFFPWKHGVDATGGQYEGFSYVGVGYYLLLLWSAPRLQAKAKQGWRHALCVLAVIVGCTAFAVSNRVFLNGWEIVVVPLPERVLAFAGMFRSSGRFVWPLLYGLAALAIAGAAERKRRASAAILLVAAAVQWMDTAPLRAAVTTAAAGAAPVVLDAASWRSAIARHDSIRVLPSFACLADDQRRAKEIAIEIQVWRPRRTFSSIPYTRPGSSRIAPWSNTDRCQTGIGSCGSSCLVRPRSTACAIREQKVRFARRPLISSPAAGSCKRRA